MPKLRHFFAGSNSGRGFYSFFQNIIGDEAQRIYLLKGGPGTGKSRFMEDLARAVGQRGYERELFFCSSDSNSLDAVAFPELGVAIIDATKPHALDAEWPGCRDELICLGNFWSGQGLREHREEIMSKGREKQEYFASAFRYFEAARLLEENIAAKSSKEKSQSRDFLGDIFAKLDQARINYNTRGQQRHLFASALTPEGYVSHVRTLVATYEQIYILTGVPGTGRSQYLEQLASHAQRVGLDTEVFHYPLDPRKILHILIPKINLAVLTSIDLDPLAYIPGIPVDFGVGSVSTSTNVDQRLLRELFDFGFQALRKAQQAHSQVEGYYRDQMDFQALNTYREQVLQEILSL